MSCSAAMTKNLKKTGDSDSDVKFSTEKNKTNSYASDALMSQTICLFKKYLITRSQNNVGKTNMEESEVIKRRTAARPLLPPKFGCNLNRHPSFLEQDLLPGLGCDALQSELSVDKPSTSQLTIFYAGAITVHDHVPADKAQAIMLLAGESSLSKPVVTEKPTASSLSVLPMARKYSIQCFLQKRRGRKIGKSPYAPPISRHENDDGAMDNGCYQPSFILSPFPLRLGQS